MKFRYARHTNALQPIIDFYTHVMGFEVLGNFENHAGYDGVFLGLPGNDWHLEFTCSEQAPQHQADADDLLVFYCYSEAERQAIVRASMAMGHHPVQSTNPYWQEHGMQLNDPDGYGLILALQEIALKADDICTHSAREKGLHTWNNLVNYVQQLPYGRNATRTNFELVLTEGRGTCSTKHALLKQIADANGITDVKLIMGVYKMDEENSPAIGNVLSNAQIQYVPEAHCYLKINGRRLDIMSPASDIDQLMPYMIEETEIIPEQTGTFKVEYHRTFMQQWVKNHLPDRDFEEVWAIREQCITAMTSKQSV